MSNVEWREINLDNVHEYIGKTVRVAVDRLEGAVYSTLRVADYVGFTVDGSAYEGPLSYDWDEARLTYAWHPSNNPVEIKYFFERMDESGVDKYAR